MVRASVLCSSTWPLDWLLPDAGRLLGRPLLLARHRHDTSATSRAQRCEKPPQRRQPRAQPTSPPDPPQCSP
eukprot:scaffold64489_cov34-Phaeocystis_antarctica.AAC.1